MPKAEDTVLEVVGYCGGFVSETGELTAFLDDVTFYVPRGRITAIVGETGSGKSLIMLSMLGLAPRAFRPTSGSIMFNGTDLLAASEEVWAAVRGARISYVCQDAHAALNPVITVGKQLADVYRRHHPVSRREAWERATDMLRRVRVPDPGVRMRQYPHEFSGGMAQRAMIAMALLCDAEVMLLDEPTTGLDVTIQAGVLDLISDIIAGGSMTGCMVTHDLGVVARTCQDVVVLHEGRVKERGRCEDILRSPQDAYTRSLIAAGSLEGPER